MMRELLNSQPFQVWAEEVVTLAVCAVGVYIASTIVVELVCYGLQCLYDRQHKESQ
jgi:hypothetical protein